MKGPRARVVIVNADDYGLSPGTDAGICDCVAAGVVTSVSVMSMRATAESIERLRGASPAVGLGLHIDLTADLRRHRTGDVTPRIREQWERFCDIAGTTPDHVDTHKHAHRDHPEVLAAVAALRVPVRATGAAMRRALRKAGARCPDQFVGDVGVDGKAWWTSARFARSLRDLRPGVTEVMCHPGRGDDVPEALSYRGQRADELRVFSSPRWVARMMSLELESATFAVVGGPRKGRA